MQGIPVKSSQNTVKPPLAVSSIDGDVTKLKSESVIFF